MPHYVTYADARRALERNETSCEALVSSFLATIREKNESLNIFLSIHAEEALAQARALDRERAAGVMRPLTGMVMGIKDVICIKGQPATCGSRMLQNFVSLYDATAVARLREAGAVFIGKLNCDEFAMGSSNENSYFGPVRNPANPDYVPGGSSGGSAAAVAAGLCHATLGTDTGGSIRQPAALCGVVGLKTTYGRVSRMGLVAFASSFDSIGPFASNVEDLAAVLQVMAGADSWDSTSAPIEVPDYQKALTGSVEGLKIGLPEEFFAEGLDAGIRSRIQEVIDKLKADGATFQEVSLPYTRYGIATYYILTTAEASSNLARYDGVRYGHRADMAQVQDSLSQEKRALESAIARAEAAGDTEQAARMQHELDLQDSVLERLYQQTRAEGFGPEVKRRIMLGTYVLSAGYYDAYYGKAQQVRTLIRRDFDRVFEDVDLLLTPTTPTPAFKLGSKVDDPLEMYLSDIYTVTGSLAGVPGLVVPIGTHPEQTDLPVGVQLMGPHFREDLLLRAGDVVMQ